MPENLDVAMSVNDTIRQLIAEEQDAVISYTERAEQVDDPRIKAVLLDIAEEEKQHAGELLALLSDSDPQEDEALRTGAEEVASMDETIEKAWQEFKKSNQTSIEDKLDVLLAQNQEIRVDTERTADLVPAVMGNIAEGTEAQTDELAQQAEEVADDMSAEGMDAEGVEGEESEEDDPYAMLDDLDSLEEGGGDSEEGVPEEGTPDADESDVIDNGIEEVGDSDSASAVSGGEEPTEESDVIDGGESEEEVPEGEPEGDAESEEDDYWSEGVGDSDSEDEGSDVIDEGETEEESVKEESKEEPEEDEEEKARKMAKARNDAIPSTRTIKSIGTPMKKQLVRPVDKPPFSTTVGQTNGAGVVKQVIEAMYKALDDEPMEFGYGVTPDEAVKKDIEFYKTVKMGLRELL